MGAAILILLDLSAAFDTIDHNVLHDRLERRIGITDTALKWFDSYHQGRSQSTVVNLSKSKTIDVLFGGPQGSIMGPEDYKVYTLPVGDIIKKHGLDFHIYADDTQQLVSFLLKATRALDTAISFKHVSEISNHG